MSGVQVSQCPQVDLHSNPRFSSQLPAIFTDEVARRQELQETQWCAVAELSIGLSKGIPSITCVGEGFVGCFLNTAVNIINIVLMSERGL
jgi:hypothetical protein